MSLIATDKHCAKQPLSEKSDNSPTSKANNVLSLVRPSDTRIAQCSPTGKKQTPRKPKNSDRRSREYLTEQEVKQLREAASKVGRNGFRDSLIILMAYRHGLRVSEISSLRWDQVDLTNARIFINRSKGSVSGTHPLNGDEQRALRKLLRENPAGSPWLFMSERKGQLSSRAIQVMIARAGEEANLPFPVHPHMLRHACGYELINRYDNLRLTQDFLGHANVSNTVLYTKLSDRKYREINLGG